jgi:hypothetical protein
MCNCSRFVKGCFIAFTCWVLVSLPQESIAQQYGARSGLTFSSITGQGTFNIRPGLQVGVFADFGSSEPLYFRAEFLLSQRGSFNWNLSNVNGITVYHAEVPVMYCIEFLEKFTINLGFAPAILITATRKSAEQSDGSFRFIGRELKRVDYSTFAGIEYMWKYNLEIGMRYNHSFTPLTSYDSDLYVDKTLPVLRTFQVYVNYTLNKKQN